ncbi:hypothetical protein NDN08_007829 [Rhodosorus marinus]|uniref:Uncharacterized protein n=1 Tax=Rhodosorus marinus TaxID=101924 RepID=A0AAV8V1G4_9RHOD|nr:hypothetical protein NDN08_007829 [Rhodosorus marinus]
MAKAILFGVVLVAALCLSAALGANVVAITGPYQDTIQLNDVESLKTVQTIEGSGTELFQLVSMGKYVYVTSVNSLAEYHGVIRMYEVQSGTNKLEFVRSKTYGTKCIQPVALTASYDYTDEPAVVMTCLATTTVLVVDPETLELIQLLPEPSITGIRIKDIGMSAMTARYLYVTYSICPQSDDEFSKGLVVQYSRNMSEILNYSIVRGQTSYLEIAGSSDLFLTSSGNGASYLLQLNPNTLEEVDRTNPQGFDFKQMAMNPNQKSFYMYIQKSGNNMGRIRSYDQTKYPAEKFCSDVRIDMSPATQPIVINDYVFIRSDLSMTRFTLKNGSGCPLQNSQKLYGLNVARDSGVAVACLECLPIS